MARVPLEIANGFYQSDSLPLSAQNCINWRPIVAENEALNRTALFDGEGLSQFSEAGTLSNRGSFFMRGVAYFLNGEALHSISSLGVSVNVGTVPGTGRVSMASNGQFLVIVIPEAEAYVYDNVADTITKITDPLFQSSTTVVYKDGFFVFSASDGNQFFSSVLNDPFTYLVGDVGTAEINPDPIVALHVNHNELFVCGSDTIEIFQNVPAGSGFPFQRIPGANIQKGVVARFSLVEFDNTFMFIGGGLNERPAIWRVAGSSSVQKVSSRAIENAIQDFNEVEISNAFAWTYSSRGSFLVGFTFESTRIASKTFIYDATTSVLSAGRPSWHQRQTGPSAGRWRVNSILDAYGFLLVGDSEDGRIGLIDKNIYTEYGNAIHREVTTQPFNAGGASMFVGRLELTMETGEAVQTGQGSDPQIRLDYSRNGGRTYGSEFWRSYGATGEYSVVPTWRKQGKAKRDRILRLKTSEPVKSTLIRLDAIAEKGAQ